LQLAWTAVQRIACDREVDCREVHTNLVRPPGLEPDVEQGVAWKQLDDLEMRDRVARRVRIERALERITAIAADRRLDPAPPGARTADHQREIVTLDLAP